MKELFLERCRDYFKSDYERFEEELSKPQTHGFFLNTLKGNKEDILSLVDFDYEEGFVANSYRHFNENIGKTKAYELGLIYPQGIEAALPTSVVDVQGPKVILDICSAPGGKTINIANRCLDSIIISNEYQHKRALILSSNLERMGIDNVIITNKETSKISSQLERSVDIVLVDVPCSGEGMVRKYPEIFDDYSLNNINKLASLQSSILDDAYNTLKKDGQLVYSTCTYSLEEDENQVYAFLDRHEDMSLISMGKKSFLDNSEGQFYAYFKRNGNLDNNRLRYLKSVSNNLIEAFIKDNLNIDNYYLYKHNDSYYLSLKPLYDLGNNVLKYGIYVGEIINNRFEPSHNLYRANSLQSSFKRKYDLNDEEYSKYIEGLELPIKLENGYIFVTYKGFSLGLGKIKDNRLKNKYPKGLRRLG